MITKYIKMKKQEIALKLKLFTYLNAVLTEKEHMVKLIQNLYLALKDTSAEELQEKLIQEIGGMRKDEKAK